MTTFTFTTEMYEAQKMRESALFHSAQEQATKQAEANKKKGREYMTSYGQDAIIAITAIVEKQVREMNTLANMHNKHFYWQHIKPLQQDPKSHIEAIVANIVAVSLVSKLSRDLTLQHHAGNMADDMMFFLKNEYEGRVDEDGNAVPRLDDNALEYETLRIKCMTFFSALIDAVAERTDIFYSEQVDGREIRLFLTDEWNDRIAEYEKSVARSASRYEAMTVPPVPHKDFLGTAGGYLTSSSPLLKDPARDEDGNIHPDLVSFKNDKYLAFLNKVQAVPYAVNKPLLSIISEYYKDGISFEDFPQERPNGEDDIAIERMLNKLCDEEVNEINERRYKYAMNNGLEYTPISEAAKRKVRKKHEGKFIAKLNKTKYTLSKAEDFSHYEAIYFPVFLCGRARIYPYASGGFCYQGNTMAKALLTFANKHVMTTEGLFAMYESLANAISNKSSFDTDHERMSLEEKRAKAAVFFNEHKEDFFNGKFDIFFYNTIGMDDPINALAVCVELVQYYKNPRDFKTGYIAHRDARCSGSSLIATMLQERTIMEQTSVIPVFQEDGHLPDAYISTANMALAECEERAANGCKLAAGLLEYKDVLFIRKVFKNPLMCKGSYGLKDWSLKEMNKDLDKMNWNEMLSWDHKKLFDTLMINAINKSAPASTLYLNTIKDVAKEVVNRDGYFSFKSPFTGFPVILTELNTNTRRITIPRPFGDVKLNVVTIKKGMNKMAIRNATAPGAVHHVDASVLYMVAQQMEGDICFIHDSMATNINDTHSLVGAYAKVMCFLHESDPLNKILESVGTDIRLPLFKTTTREDVRNILSSQYCIA